MTYKLNPFTGKLDTSDGPQGPAGVVSAAGPGSQATPSISFAADLDTGLYNYTANGIAVSTGGTGRLFVDANGNVGVGTSSPIALYRSLSIHGNATDQGGVLDLATSDQSSRAYVFNDSNGLSLQTATTHPILIKTDNVERLRVTSDGKVGVGTSSPQTLFELAADNATGGNNTLRFNDTDGTTQTGQQVGAIEFFSNDTLGGSGVIGKIECYSGGTAGNGIIGIKTGYGTTLDTRLTINHLGNVGIGTESPSYPLSILSAGNNFLQFSRSGDSVVGCLVGRPAGIDALRLQATENIPIEFLTNNQERARIDSDGRLLVGTASTSANTTLLLQASSGGATFASVLNMCRGSVPVSDGTPLGVIDFSDTGHVSAASISALKDGSGTWTSGSSQPSRLTFSTTPDGSATPQVRMTIKNDGNVGIGTESPSALLHINEGSAGAAGLRLQNTEGYHELRTNNDELTIVQGTNERLRIDSSGRVGIGTTSPIADFVVSNGGADGIELQPNIVANTNRITNYDRNGGSYSNFRLDAAQQEFLISGSEKARIDSSGRLLVGTSTELAGGSSTTFLQVAGGTGGSLAISRSGATTNAGDTIGEIAFFDNASGNDKCAAILCAGDLDHASGDKPSRLVFSTTADGASSPTERMRIGNKGNVTITSVADNDAALRVDSNGTSGAQYGIYIETGNDQNDAIRTFIGCVGGATTRAQIRSNGGIANYSANDVNLSDRNVKKNIAPAADTWNCLKDWEIVNFHYKDQTDDADLNMGVIAQQVAENCPEVVTVFQEAKEATETEPAQEERIGVKEQQMMWMAIKALQEAQIRIETLEAEVAALKAS